MEHTQDEKNGIASKAWTEASDVATRHGAVHATFAVIGTVVLLPLAIVGGMVIGTRLLYKGLKEHLRDREFHFEWQRRYDRAVKALKEDA